MKHWTEPNGILLIHIPVDWQYLNPAIGDGVEESPYGFQPYDDPIGCFQLSCYPLADLAPNVAKNNSDGVKNLNWKRTRADDSECCMHLYYGALGDQGLIGKYIYDPKLENDGRIKEQLAIVEKILKSLVIVPEKNRNLAANLDKFDRFVGALAASTDLLNASIESESYIQIIVVAANQIDAYLRLCLVIDRQIKDETDEIEIRYLFQADNDRGMIERRIFEHSLDNGIISQSIFDELNSLYHLRNRVMHRYILSGIKTRDMVSIVSSYLKAVEKIRLVLAKYEKKQGSYQFGVYGSKSNSNYKANELLLSDADAHQALFSAVNDKHLLGKFKRKIKSY